MTAKKLKALFAKHEDEFLEFERIDPAARLSNCPDVHGFLLLERLCPTENNCDMVAGADHDVIYLRPDLDDLAKVITEADVIDLQRCGISVDTAHDCLYSFA